MSLSTYLFLMKNKEFEWSWHKVLVGEPACEINFNFLYYFNSTLFKMSLSNLDLNFWEDFFVIFFSYSILKYIIFSLIIEIIWPTSFFNRKHLIGFTAKRFRTFTETILKLKNFNSYQSTNYFYIFIYLLK